MEKPALQHIVDEEAIMQLIKTCPMCSRTCRGLKKTHGPYVVVYQNCYFCNFQRKWASQPEAIDASVCNAYVSSRKKRKPKSNNKATVEAKAQSSQLNKSSRSESSVSNQPLQSRSESSVSKRPLQRRSKSSVSKGPLQTCYIYY